MERIKVLDFQKVYISLLNSEVKNCRLIVVLEALTVQLPHLKSPFCLEGKELNACAMSYKVQHLCNMRKWQSVFAGCCYHFMKLENINAEILFHNRFRSTSQNSES